MIPFIRLIMVLALCWSTWMCIDLGFSWIDTYHGLNPVLAFPLAMVCIAMIIILIFQAHAEYMDNTRIDQDGNEYICD